MNKKTLRKFVSEKQRRIEKSIQSLEQGDIEEAKRQIEWLETTTRVFEIYKNKKKYFWSIIFTVFSIILVSLSCILHISKVNVLIDLTLCGLQFSILDNWKISDQIIADGYYINNLHNISTDTHLQGFHEMSAGKNPSEIIDMSIEGRKIKLTQFELLANALIELELNPNQLQIYIKGSPLKGKFSIRQGQAIIKGKKQLYDNPINLPPSTISFITVETNYDDDPIRFDINSNCKWEFNNLRVNSLIFYQENPPNSGNFESTIESGKIKVYEYDDQILLDSKEILNIEIASNRNTSIKRLDNKFHLIFKGEVKKINAGPEGFEKNLKPTLLEYFYYNKRLTFLWSALVFIWGLLWSIKNTLLRKI